MQEIQFPRIELLRAEATLLYLDKISNQLIAEFQQKAIEITKNMKDFVMTHKWLGKMCTFEELEMSYSGTCDEKSLIHNYINLNFCHEFKNQIFEHCLIAFEKLIKKYQKMQLISSQVAKQYDTQYLVYENEEYVDRLSSFGIMCVFACIQDENNFYDSKVFLKAKGNGIELPRTPKGISIKNTNNYIKSEEQSHRTSEAQIDDLSLEQDLYIAPKQTVDNQKTETLKLRKYPDNKNPDNNSSQSIQKIQTEKEDTLKYFKPVVERTAQQQDQIVNKSLIQMLGTKVEEIHEIRRSDSKSFASKPSSSNLDEPVSSSVSQPARIQTKLEIQNKVRSQEDSKKGHEQSKQLSQQPDQKKTIDQILETQLKNEEDIRNFNKMMNEPESAQLQKAFAKQMSKDEILEQMKQQYKNRKQAEVQDDDLALAVKNKQKQQQNNSQQLNNNSKSGKKQAELEDMLKSFDDIEKPIDDLYNSPKQNTSSQINQVINKSENKVRQSFQINQPVKYEPQNSSKVSSQIQSKNQSKVQFTETESEQQMKTEPKISNYAVKKESQQENVAQQDKYDSDLYQGQYQSLEEQKYQLNVNQQAMNIQIKDQKPAYDQKDAVIKQLNIRIAELEQKQALQSQNQNLDNILLKDAQNDQVKLIKLQYESYIKQLKMDITKLTQENSELCKIKLVEQSPQTDVLKRKIEISNKNFTEVQAENTKLSQQLENSIKELKAAKIEHFKKIDDLTLQNAQLTETLNKMQDMNLKLQVENKTLTQQIQRNAPTSKQENLLLQQVQAENKTLTQQLQSQNDLIAQNDLLQEEIIQLQAENQQAQQYKPQNESQKIIELTNKCSKLTQQIQMLQEENEQNQQFKTNENEDTQKLLELTQRQQKIIQKLQQQAKQQNELITEAKGKTQIKSQCEIHYQIISDLEEQIIQKNARIRAIEHDLVEFQSDNRLEVAEERLRYKEQENERLYKQVQELREINTELINDMENMCK
ncbi:Conserved_hypothetical protein [Hexamita inflata]|uniref:Uncharacterized protein n=1 Tax=Hexamita inflata TaxID=28002 RepID=A0AA86PIC7_9EUKA|nr:Conserved hypothetical protein [Hexamita inflata]